MLWYDGVTGAEFLGGVVEKLSSSDLCIEAYMEYNVLPIKEFDILHSNIIPRLLSVRAISATVGGFSDFGISLPSDCVIVDDVGSRMG